MQSKRERVLLFGVIPIVAAILGSLATVWASNYLGHSTPSDAVVRILGDPALTAAEKQALLVLVNNETDRFYDFLGRILSIVSITCGVFSVAFAHRIYRQ